MIDLHTHSMISDGTDTVPELIRAARAAGIDTLALTDHDTMDGVDEAKACGRREGVDVLRGVEISTHLIVDGSHHPVHLLGYGCADDDEDLATLLRAVREARLTRVPRILELLAELGMPLDLEEVQVQAAGASSSGRPHVADAMVARGYVASRDEAFRDWLYDHGPAYVVRYTPTVAEAIDAINRAHGVAVIAHPWGRGNREAMSAEILAGLARTHGLFGIEADHVEHTEDERRILHELAHDLGLVATGSSDYHGSGKTRNPLGVFTTPPKVYRAITHEIEERGGQP